MTIYWLSFRIEYEPVGGKSYEDRYREFEGAIIEVRNAYWEETTSFCIFDSEYSIDQIAAKLKAAFAPSKDLFLIRQLDHKTAIYCGDLKDPDLRSLMPYAKKA